jgi:hypothetical protein
VAKRDINLVDLLDQTEFLLQKQTEMKHEIESIYTDFLSFVDKVRQNFKDNRENLERLDNIHELLTTKQQSFAEEIQEDIDFLFDQCSTLKHIKSLPDKEKAAQILDELTQDMESLAETGSFKKEVMEEYEHSKKDLLNVVTDLKEALKEGNIKEVESMIESSFEDEVADDEEEDNCCGGECDEQCSCCNDSHAKQHKKH